MDITTFEKHKRLMLESLGIRTEGVDDPIIFKAVFMAGGPGSGKSYIVKQIGFEGMGFKVLNSDDVYEVMLKRAGMTMDPENIYSPKGQEIRGRAKQITAIKEKNWVDGRIGIVIDGTGKDYTRISQTDKWLKEIGYETMMVLVNADLKTTLSRVKGRERKLPPQEVEAMWNGVQSNIGKFQSLFGSKNFIVLDNSEANQDSSGKFASNLYGKINAWAKKVPNNKIAQDWIKSQGGRI